MFFKKKLVRIVEEKYGDGQVKYIVQISQNSDWVDYATCSDIETAKRYYEDKLNTEMSKQLLSRKIVQ